MHVFVSVLLKMQDFQELNKGIIIIYWPNTYKYRGRIETLPHKLIQVVDTAWKYPKSLPTVREVALYLKQ